MGLKYNKNNSGAREELLQGWTDVYGVNFDYGWALPEENEELQNCTIGLSVTSLREYGKEVDILIAMRPEDACFIIEEFLNVYQELYLNHIATRAGYEQQETND